MFAEDRAKSTTCVMILSVYQSNYAPHFKMVLITVIIEVVAALGASNLIIFIPRFGGSMSQ